MSVDLSQFKDKPDDAVTAELRMLAETREQALRDRVVEAAKAEGYARALSALVDRFGEEDGSGKKYLTLDPAFFRDTLERVDGFSMDTDQRALHLVNTYKFHGHWEVGRKEPDEAEREALPWFDTLPEWLARPGSMQAVVGTKKGLRIAEWVPRG